MARFLSVILLGMLGMLGMPAWLGGAGDAWGQDAPTQAALEPGAAAPGEGPPLVDATVQAPASARYGLGLRTRVTSIPKWLLGAFLDQSVPLTSYTVGLEGFRRTGNFDFVAGLAWQALSPSDGNWLGKGNLPSTDTDYVQFKGLGAISFDVGFVLHTALTRVVGVHYGGGVGIGFLTGKVLRTSDGSAGCGTNPGSAVDCHPVVCATGPCTESQLAATESPFGSDTATTPSRFKQTLPTVYPIVNLLTGLDFRVPSVPRLDLKVDLGFFFPYFFLGAGVAYRI
jgi:hypothetical protein